MNNSTVERYRLDCRWLEVGPFVIYGNQGKERYERRGEQQVAFSAGVIIFFPYR